MCTCHVRCYKHRSHAQQSDIVVFSVCKFTTLCNQLVTFKRFTIHILFLFMIFFLACATYTCNKSIATRISPLPITLSFFDCIFFVLFVVVFYQFYFACNKTLYIVNIKCKVVIIRKIQNQ